MNSEFIIKDRIFKLRGGKAPLSVIIQSRSTKKTPLLYFDEEKGINRSIRYAKNQKSPFEDEQDDKVLLEPIIMEDGFIKVPRTNVVLQKFLFLHPDYDKKFKEVDPEADAKKEIDRMDIQADAIIAAKQLSVSQMEVLARGLLNVDPSKIPTDVLKRDLRVYANRDPEGFLNALNDPDIEVAAKVNLFFQQKLIAFRNGEKDVFFNMKANKSKLLSVPYGEDAIKVVGEFLTSNKGLEVFEMLDKALEE
jgi:hypothetical protein